MPDAPLTTKELAAELEAMAVVCDGSAEMASESGDDDTRACLLEEAATLRLAARRLAELEGVVSKLPTTADGVPIVPGMNVWFFEPCEEPEHLMVGCESSLIGGGVLDICDRDNRHGDDYPENGRHKLLVRDDHGEEHVVDPRRCYSTEAEAAQARGRG